MNKKAFTLVELMGVITILGLITLLVAPTIINQIRNSKDKIDSVTEQLIYAATDLYLDNKENDYPRYNGSTYCITLNDLVEDGKLSTPVLDSNGDEISLDKIIAVDVTDHSYQYTLSNSCEQKIGNILQNIAVGPEKCAEKGQTCALGTAFSINVNDRETYKFYVLSDDGIKITLIMDKNLGDTVAWYVDPYNSYGPVTAINYLDELTDEEWSNIPKKDYTYSGKGVDGVTRFYEDITVTMRARMISAVEVNNIIAGNNDTMPEWLYSNLYNDKNSSLPKAYWTSTATKDLNSPWATGVADSAWGSTNRRGYTVSTDVYYDEMGVRPVIELTK